MWLKTTPSQGLRSRQVRLLSREEQPAACKGARSTPAFYQCGYIFLYSNYKGWTSAGAGNSIYVMHYVGVNFYRE